MARIRTIKPEFWRSEQVTECSVMARLMFIGLWNFCDDGGRMPYSPKNIKMSIFPGDDITKDDIQRMIVELSSNALGNPLVVIYDIDGKQYLQITGWEKHQRIDRPTYQFPDPSGAIPESSSNTRRAFGEHSPPEGKGKEWNGVEGKGMDGGSLTRTRRKHDPPRPFSDWPVDYREQFRVAYPEKVGMDGALKELDKVRGTVSWVIVLDALAIYTTTKPSHREWVYPKRWIEEKRWNDRPSPASNGRVRTDADVARDLARAAEAEERQRSEGHPKRTSVEVGGTDLGGEHARDVSRPR